MKPINLADKLATFSGHWHKHDATDDFFLVLKGRLTVQMRGGDVVVGPGEIFVVPVGVEHGTVAEDEAHLLLIEP